MGGTLDFFDGSSDRAAADFGLFAPFLEESVQIMILEQNTLHICNFSDPFGVSSQPSRKLAFWTPKMTCYYGDPCSK